MANNDKEQAFLADVKHHKLSIIRNDGMYRHIRFREGNSAIMGFDLITWPGHLCYTGDMGTFVFSRVEDMFCFFRTDQSDFNFNKSGGLSINPRYWSEKCLAADRDGIKEYSAEKFQKIITDILDEVEASDELREAVQSEVLDAADEGEHRAMDAAMSFQHHDLSFDDFWEHDLKEYTHGYIWCCYALAWGIAQYDKAIASAEVKE